MIEIKEEDAASLRATISSLRYAAPEAAIGYVNELINKLEPLLKKPECWMVEGVPIEQGQETPRFGPFENEEEARDFADTNPNYHAYDVNDHKPGFRRHL